MSLLELDHQVVRQAFSRAAQHYDAHAALQQEVESRLLERLEYSQSAPATILDLGCGTGTGSRTLAGAFPDATVVSLDWSRAMLSCAREKMADSSARSVCADMHALPLAQGSVDLVFSNLAVQWSDRFDVLLLELRRVLSPGGLVMLTTFGPDTLFELRDAWSKADSQPHVNRFMDMHDIGDAFVRAGFREPVIDVDKLVMQYQSVMDLMHDLKGIGAQNHRSDRRKGLTGRQRLRSMIQAYEHHRQEDIYPATYEVVYALAFGPDEGQPIRGPEGEYAAVSIESLMKKTREGRK